MYFNLPCLSSSEFVINLDFFFVVTTDLTWNLSLYMQDNFAIFLQKPDNL